MYTGILVKEDPSQILQHNSKSNLGSKSTAASQSSQRSLDDMLLDPYSYKMKDFEAELSENFDKYGRAKMEEVINKLRFDSVGFKNVEKQIECIKTIITDRVLENLKQKHSDGLNQLLQNQKRHADIKKKMSLRSEYLCNIWIQYIESCQKKLDLYDYIQDHGICQLNASLVIQQAKFLEFGGQPDPSGNGLFCIYDYRYARKVYINAQTTIKKVQSELKKFTGTIPDLNDVEQGLFETWSVYEIEWLQEQFDQINKAYSTFCENMENILKQDMNPRVLWCKNNRQKRRSFFEAKALCEKHKSIYSRVEQTDGSQAIFIPTNFLNKKDSGYQCWVDDQYCNDHIEQGQSYVERFYEALDELDQFDMKDYGDQSDQNFFITKILNKNEELTKNIVGQDSFLDRSPHLIINQNAQSFDFINMRPTSKTTRVKNNKRRSKIEDLEERCLENKSLNEFHDLFDQINEQDDPEERKICFQEPRQRRKSTRVSKPQTFYFKEQKKDADCNQSKTLTIIDEERSPFMVSNTPSHQNIFSKNNSINNSSSSNALEQIDGSKINNQVSMSYQKDLHEDAYANYSSAIQGCKIESNGLQKSNGTSSKNLNFGTPLQSLQSSQINDSSFLSLQE